MNKELKVYVSALKVLVKKYKDQMKRRNVGTKDFRDDLTGLVGGCENDTEVNGIRCWIFGCDKGVECLICTKADDSKAKEYKDGRINDGAVLLGVELRVCNEDIYGDVGEVLWKTGTFPEDSEKIWARFSNAHLRK